MTSQALSYFGGPLILSDRFLRAEQWAKSIPMAPALSIKPLNSMTWLLEHLEERRQADLARERAWAANEEYFGDKS